MISNVIKLGNRIEIRRFSISSEALSKAKVYVSKLLDIKDEYNVSIAVPIENGHLVPLEIGSQYELRFFTQNGMYVCKSELTSRFKENNLYFLAMHVLSDLKKDQRRQYFRLEKVMPFTYHILTDIERGYRQQLKEDKFPDDSLRREAVQKLKESMHRECEAVTVNISGGGIRFLSNDALDQDDDIMLTIRFEEYDVTPFELYAKVISVQKLINKNMRFEYRIEFTDIDREIREKIVRYIFLEERKQRQKESGTV